MKGLTLTLSHGELWSLRGREGRQGPQGATSLGACPPRLDWSWGATVPVCRLRVSLKGQVSRQFRNH